MCVCIILKLCICDVLLTSCVYTHYIRRSNKNNRLNTSVTRMMMGWGTLHNSDVNNADNVT